MKPVILLLLIPYVAALTNFFVGDTFANCLKELPRPRSCAIDEEFRTIDGTCNNLGNPLLGARRTGLRRLLFARYVDGTTSPFGFPPTGTDRRFRPANLVSRTLFTVEESNRITTPLTVLFMTFGQFVDHDLSLSPLGECDITDCTRPDAFRYPCIPIRFQVGGRRCNPFARAVPVCRRWAEQRNQLNDLTSFVDGSQIYGSEKELAERIRTNDGTGKLKVVQSNTNSFTGLLPFDTKINPCIVSGGCSLVGDERGDENLALHTMHTLWVREHNRIATELKRINQRWSGERIYETSRKIVGGMLQNILYTEWLPNVARLRYFWGYNPKTNPSIINAFSTAAFRFGHSLVPNKFSQLNNNFDPVDRRRPSISLQAAFNNRQEANIKGIEPTMFGLIANRSSNVDTGFAFGIARRLFVEVGDNTREIDLLAYNIARGRDHGLPTYTRWRSFCGLYVPRSFTDLERIIPRDVVSRFRRVYDSVFDIDLYAGGISETRINGLQVGPTFSCLIKRQFEDVRDGDRFFYLAQGVFTPAQRAEIQRSSMARVMCDNLKGLTSIQPNAFRLDSTGNGRISCDRISRMSLEPFRETSGWTGFF